MINFVIQHDWRWNHCRLPIKRSQKKSKRKQQEYFYQVMNSQQTGPINQDRIKITLDRPFPFQPDTGFVWHKSWNLPQIGININQEQMNSYNEQYKEVNCQIMAVYPVKYSTTYYLNQISLQGNCLRTLHENQALFKFLKFGQTSFNHGRNKFCLLIWIYGQNAYKDKDDLFCLISSPIYVDSRKQARKKQMQATGNSSNLNSPKKFTAAIGGIKGSVPNTSQGFINYYSAQNIRNKIKHPYYIAYHFDKIFRLFINQQKKLTNVEALNVIQMNKTAQVPSKASQQNIIMVQILQANEKHRKKLITIVQKWKFNSTQYIYLGNAVMNPKWLPISKQQIKTAYKLYYEAQMLKQEDQVIKNNGSDNDQNFIPSNGQNTSNKNHKQSEDKSNQIQKQKTYQLRTVIDLSRPRKKTKHELQ